MPPRPIFPSLADISRRIPISLRVQQRQPISLVLQSLSQRQQHFHVSASSPQTDSRLSTQSPATVASFISKRSLRTIPAPPAILKPEYEMTFTCTPCGTRSTHRISKQGYHKGSILITCPECKNRHVISDHLDIFGKKGLTIEDIMREKGQLIKKGNLSDDGDLEFWEDGTSTQRDQTQESGDKKET